MLPMLLAVCLFGPMGSGPAESSDPAPQSVDASPRIAVAPIAYSATIPEHTRVAVHETVTEAVQGIAQDALLLDVDAECRTRECALRQARDANAEFLLEMQITVDARDYAIEIVVLGAKDGRQLTEASGQCRLCAQAELLAAIAAQVASLEAALDRGQAAPMPSVEAVPTAPMPSRMQPAAGARPTKLQIGGWVSVALGLAGVGAGAALIALDGRDHGPTCGVDVRDINGACPNVYTTQLAGIISVSAGGVALATGTGLVLGGKARRSRGAAALLVPAPGGVGLRF